MNASHFKTRLLIAALATGVGAAVLFGEKWSAWIPKWDVACVKATFGSNRQQGKIFDTDTKARTITMRTLEQQAGNSREFQLINITDDPDQIFEHSPPSPLDYAVILESLKNRGYGNVVLTTRMTWDDEPGLEARGLSGRLALFDRSIIALPVTRGATAKLLPDPLEHSLIPLSQVHGNHQLIPMVNQVSLPTHANGGKRTLAGFHRIESSPSSKGNIPLLAHWQGEGLIPSIDLLAVMVAHRVSPSELIIQCGKHIRLGKDGPVIPLDDYGQTQALRASSVTTHPTPLNADELITQKSSKAAPKQSQICLIHATGKKTASTNTLNNDRLQSLFALTNNSLIPGKAATFHRLPLWADLVIVVDIALLAAWFSGFNRGNRHLAFALMGAFLFPLLMALIDVTNHWFGLTAPLAALIIAWLIPLRSNQRKQTSPINQYNTTDPKPSLRV